MTERLRTILGVVAGPLLLLSAVAHALLGRPAMSAALADVGAGEELAGPLAVGWYFGSMAMLVFALVVLRIALRGPIRSRSGLSPSAI